MSFRRTILPLAPLAVLFASSPAHAVDGVLKAWGRNVEGQTTIPGGLGTVKDADGGTAFTIVLKSDGTLAAWGDNASGQTTIPTGLGTVIRVAAGAEHALAILENNSVRAWGLNTSGQATVPGDLLAASQIAGGNQHSMSGDGAVLADFNSPRIVFIVLCERSPSLPARNAM
jgi:alpha-tubulin suppressor-like RCC1 family protein